MVIQTSDNRFSVADFIVDPIPGKGTHTTIQSAINDAVAPTTIFIKPGTYTETIVVKPGVHLDSFTVDMFEINPSVIIDGDISYNSGGSCTFSNIRLQGGPARALIRIDGGASSKLRLERCFFEFSDSSGIVLTSSSPSAEIDIANCEGELTFISAQAFVYTGSGTLKIFNTKIRNPVGSATTGRIEGPDCQVTSSRFEFPFEVQGNLTMTKTELFTETNNRTCMTLRISGIAAVNNCNFLSGSAKSLGIETGCALTMTGTNVVKTTDPIAITGAGSLDYAPVTFTGTGTDIDVLTQTIIPIGKDVHITGDLQVDGVVSFKNQILSVTTSALITCNVNLPVDDTIPQNTEGNEVLTLGITPRSATSVLIITFNYGSQQTSAASSTAVALFQDSIANALAAQQTSGISTTASVRHSGTLIHSMVSGTTSPTVFKIRVGPSSGTNNIYINGAGGLREFGGSASTTLSIIEVIL